MSILESNNNISLNWTNRKWKRWIECRHEIFLGKGPGSLCVDRNGRLGNRPERARDPRQVSRRDARFVVENRIASTRKQSEIPSHLSCDAIFKFFFPFLFNYPKRTISQRRNLKFNFFAFLYESFEMLSFLYLMENYRITLPFVMRMKEKLQRS